MAIIKPKRNAISGTSTYHEVTKEDVIWYFTEPKYTYEERRNEKKGGFLAHVHKDLWGDSRRFVMAYCKTNNRLIAVDGGRRVFALQAGAQFAAGVNPCIEVVVVDTMTEVWNLYCQVNSLAAAKKTACFFESGLNKANLRNVVTSKLVLNPHSASAIKLATGIYDNKRFPEAVERLKQGIIKVDSMGLERNPHETRGLLAAYFIIANHSQDFNELHDFIVNMNLGTFVATGSAKGAKVLTTLLDCIKNHTSRNTQEAHNVIFEATLGAYRRFSDIRKGRKVSSAFSPMTLGEFLSRQASNNPSA